MGRPRVCFVYLSGGQLSPTDRAMAARSARTSSSEEASRSTDDEQRLLTKRSIEWHRANNWETLLEGEKAENKIIQRIQAVTSLFFLETNLSHDGPHRSQGDFCVSMIGRGPALSAAKISETAVQTARHTKDAESRGPRENETEHH